MDGVLEPRMKVVTGIRPNAVLAVTVPEDRDANITVRTRVGRDMSKTN